MWINELHYCDIKIACCYSGWGTKMMMMMTEMHSIMDNLWRVLCSCIILFWIVMLGILTENFFAEPWISISSLVVMFLCHITWVRASHYYAMTGLCCLNKNMFINNALLWKLIQILAAYEVNSSYLQNECGNCDANYSGAKGLSI